MYSHFAVTVAVCSVVFPVLALVTVLLRLRARQLNASKFGLDDYLVGTALMCALAMCFIFLSGSITASIGQDLSTITPPQFVKYQKHIYAGIIATYSTFGFVKLSVLQFYKRIFSTPLYVKMANTLMILVAAWMAVTLGISIFSAWPIHDFWRLGSSYTVNHPAFLFWSTLLDCAFDFAILCIPIPAIFRLKITLKKKFQLAAVFSMGFFCVLAAALRIYFGYRLSTTASNTQEQVDNAHFNYIVVNNVIWCEIEACFSIIAACLPCFGPYMKALQPHFVGFGRVISLIRSSYNSSRMSRHSSREAKRSQTSDEPSLSESSSARDLVEIRRQSRETQTESFFGCGQDLGNITITHDIAAEFAERKVAKPDKALQKLGLDTQVWSEAV